MYHNTTMLNTKHDAPHCENRLIGHNWQTCLIYKVRIGKIERRERGGERDREGKFRWVGGGGGGMRLDMTGLHQVRVFEKSRTFPGSNSLTDFGKVNIIV